MSANASPYRVKGSGDGLGVVVGVCEAVGCGVAVGDACGNEHDKRGNAKAIDKINSLTFGNVVIRVLLTIQSRGIRLYIHAAPGFD
jgi:hypothetical protein